MQLVLDTNEYIFAFGYIKETSPHPSKRLIPLILELFPLYELRISRLIVEEVRPHLALEDFAKFIRFINDLTLIDEDIVIPFELGAKYEDKGLKSSDALIAAYCEWTGADILVTENRHFLCRQPDLPFKVLSSEKCLKLIKTSR